MFEIFAKHKRGLVVERCAKLVNWWLILSQTSAGCVSAYGSLHWCNIENSHNLSFFCVVSFDFIIFISSFDVLIFRIEGYSPAEEKASMRAGGATMFRFLYASVSRLFGVVFLPFIFVTGGCF